MCAFFPLRAFATGLALLTPFTVISAAVAQQGLVDRYHASLRMATEDNEFSEAAKELDVAVDTFRALDPENPQLAALFLLRGVLRFATEGESARSEILHDLQNALRVHPWAEFEPSMRSEPLDELLEEARDSMDQAPPERGYAFGRSVPDCDERAIIYAAYSNGLGVKSATLHWRGANQSDFVDIEMQQFAGVVFLEISPADHGNQDGAYYIELKDANGEVVGRAGTQSSPQTLDFDCEVESNPESPEPREAQGKRGEEKRKSAQKGSSRRFRRVGLRILAGTGWGISYGASERVYDIANPNKPGHYSLLATSCAIARRAAAPGGGPLPKDKALFGSDASSPAADSIFGRVAASPAQAAQLAAAYDADRCAQMHPINSGVASSFFHLEPELSVRISEHWEMAAFSRLQLIHGLDILSPLPDAPVDSLRPEFELLKIPMPWTVGLKGRYRGGAVAARGFSWFVGFYAGYGQAALAIPMPFGHDRNGNSVADENEVSCSVGPSQAPVFPAMDGCSNPDKSASAIGKLKREAKSGGQARDVLHLGKAFAGIELGMEYMFTSVVGVSASAQIGAWFAGRRSSGLLDLKFGPSLRF